MHTQSTVEAAARGLSAPGKASVSELTRWDGRLTNRSTDTQNGRHAVINEVSAALSSFQAAHRVVNCFQSSPSRIQMQDADVTE